jgi:hypothetical protein
VKNELSVDRLIKFFPAHSRRNITVTRGPLLGHAGRAFELGRDGEMRMQVPWPGRPNPVVITVDWLDTDIAPASMRVAYRARRKLAAIPELGVNGCARVLPARVVNEDLSDFIEQIRASMDDGKLIRALLLTAQAAFWTALNSLVYALRSLSG